jgi:hypothetical protein
VRVVGGAYGGFCDFDTHSGMFTYSSYRDPNLLKTVDVYDGEPPAAGQQGSQPALLACTQTAAELRVRGSAAGQRIGVPGCFPFLPAALCWQSLPRDCVDRCWG